MKKNFMLKICQSPHTVSYMTRIVLGKVIISSTRIT